MSNKKIPIKKKLKSLIKSKKIQKRNSTRKIKTILLYLLSSGALITTIIIFGTIIFGVINQGSQAFVQTHVLLTLDPAQQKLAIRDYFNNTCASSTEISTTINNGQCKINDIISNKAEEEISQTIKEHNAIQSHPDNLRIWVTATSKIDMFMKGKIAADQIDNQVRLTINHLIQNDLIKLKFNKALFTSTDSSWPETAGLLGAILGSLMTMLVCTTISVPIGILTGIYLQEFAPNNKIIHLIKVNIYNLASTPSVVFGLLGGYLCLEILHIPRSSSLAGGLTLALIMLPIIIIITKHAIKSVPQSIKEAALALGASHAQALFHHILPLALPEIMTGIMLGTARILGETAPLLIIGMTIFNTEIPSSITDVSNSLSTQIYLWSKNPDISFVERTGAAIIILVLIISILNILAATIKNKFSKF